MLIPSHRHTPADLRLWAECEEADLMHGRSLALYRQVSRSLAAIKTFAERGPCYAGCSCGKDSVVLAGLIHEANVDVPIVWVDAGEMHNPGGEAVWIALQRACPTLQYYRVQVDRLTHVGERQKGTVETGFAVANERFGERYLSGVRAAESGTRRLSMRHRGEATDRACRPIGWWSLADVFGFLASRRLPVHSNYAMLGGGRWERTNYSPRVALLGGVRGNQFGRREWEREYYGDVLNRLMANTP